MATEQKWTYLVGLTPGEFQPEVVEMIRGAMEVGHLEHTIGLAAIVAYRKGVEAYIGNVITFPQGAA